jgi:hypothetical protein
MSLKIQTTNRSPDSPLIEVEESEFVDLYRWGLVVAGKGDVAEDGTLTKKAAKEAPLEVQTATGQVPIQQFQKTEA